MAKPRPPASPLADGRDWPSPSKNLFSCGRFGVERRTVRSQGWPNMVRSGLVLARFGHEVTGMSRRSYRKASVVGHPSVSVSPRILLGRYAAEFIGARSIAVVVEGKDGCICSYHSRQKRSDLLMKAHYLWKQADREIYGD